MVPAAGIISLFWALACLALTSKADVYNPTVCCSCGDLKPIDPPRQSVPQVMPSPFRLQVKEADYTPGAEIHVNVYTMQEDEYFRSFYLGAYVMPYKPGDLPVGKINLLKDQGIEVDRVCVNSDDMAGINANGVKSKEDDESPKTSLKFTWIPARYYGHVEFRATFVKSDFVFWVAEKSAPLQDPTKPPLASRFVQSIPSISTEGCGSTKGCFREPAGCIEPHCMYIVTWHTDRSTQYTEIELGGLADGSNDRYVALGLSDDTYMGDDAVFACAHNVVTGRTEVYFSHNEPDTKKNIAIAKYDVDGRPLRSYQEGALYKGLVKEEGSYNHGRLRCRFTLKRNLKKYQPLMRSLNGGPVHLLLAHGFADGGELKRHGLGVELYPVVSAEKVDFYAPSDLSERATYPLAKAHGCLMLLAWIFFASIGLLLTKYYKPMWPNKRMFDQRYWFVGHFNFMAMTFIITIIGFILIFVEAGGYSEAPDLPQKAHPILGIIIFICIIINPILALLRPNPDHDCRPVFNWFHWAFGTIANVLAIPQIFIGMDFGKVFVPWWATWILVIWVIFHIAVELTLEIHQCCTYKKNKERRKKHEHLKREYPKQHHPEPEPAGRRFKRFMLFLHFGITTLITLIMIIIIAVS